MRNVMAKAWKIAKEGQKKFGGKVKEYFAEALRIAWAIVKKGMEKIQFVGSEKQVAWANDIYKEVVEKKEWYLNFLNSMKFKSDSMKEKTHNRVQAVFDKLMAEEQADVWIYYFSRMKENDFFFRLAHYAGSKFEDKMVKATIERVNRKAYQALNWK